MNIPSRLESAPSAKLTASFLGVLPGSLSVAGGGQQRLWDFIRADPERILHARVEDVARGAGVGAGTVSRLCTSLGYNGFNELKVALAGEVAAERFQQRIPLQDSVDPGDDSAVVVRKVAAAAHRAVDRALDNVRQETLESVVNLLVTADDILACGVGTSGLGASHAAFQFARIGLPCHAASDPAACALGAANLRANGVVLLFSTSGISRTAVMVARLAHERGRPVVALTSNLRSHLARLASHVLTVAAEEPSLYRGKTTAAISQLCVVDALHALVALRLGDSAVNCIVTSGTAMSRMNDLPDRYRQSSGRDP